MPVSRLRRSGARRRAFGQNVPVENRDFFEMGRERLRRRDASQSGSDDDGLLGERMGHRCLSQMCV